MVATTITIVGAGGVGCLLGARLVRGGHDVRMLARGAALQVIRERGLLVRGPDGEHAAALARASDDAAALGPSDLVVVTVKTWQLAELGPRLRPLIGDGTLVVPLQNGVEASELLGGALGDAHVIGAVARMLCWVEQPGEVRWIGAAPSLTLGARQPAQADAVEACAAALRLGGLEVLVTRAIERARWMKLLFIAPFGAVGAVERAPVGVVRAQPAARARLAAAMAEVAEVAAARGVALPADAVQLTLARIDELPADGTSSMHRDLVDGRPSELHELLGAVVRLGREAGVATPVSAELYAALAPLEQAARA